MLETSRLLINPGSLSDAASLLELNSDPDVVRFTGDSMLFNLAEAENIIRERMIGDFQKYKMSRFSVFLKDGTYIGWCGLKYFPQNEEVDLGYRFMKKYWGQGYATEASIACLEYGFGNLQLKMITARAMPENIGSIKVMQKLGMTFKGYHNDPTDPHAFVRYEMTREEFKS